MSNTTFYKWRTLRSSAAQARSLVSHEFVRWATEQGIHIEYIQPSKPQQNTYIERYNRTIRYSWLSKHLFDTLEEVQDYATSWLWHYDYERPHQANKGRPPLMAA